MCQPTHLHSPRFLSIFAVIRSWCAPSSLLKIHDFNGREISTKKERQRCYAVTDTHDCRNAFKKYRIRLPPVFHIYPSLFLRLRSDISYSFETMVVQADVKRDQAQNDKLALLCAHIIIPTPASIIGRLSHCPMLTPKVISPKMPSSGLRVNSARKRKLP